MPEVLNISDFSGKIPSGSKYVGRGTFAGNPYRIGVDGTRPEVIAKFIAEKEKDEAFIARVRRELRGFHLVCHCAPKLCHANWLCEVANGD